MSILDYCTRSVGIYLLIHGRLRQEDCHKSEASLGYTLSSRLTKTTQWGLCSKDHTQDRKNYDI